MIEKHMLRALEISKSALPHCVPNPPVGCVLVKGGKIISEGFTQAIGGNHAEVQALKLYTGSMNDLTAYVTLEPCAFVGRTPACAEAINKSGIKHVVVGMLDPDPRNNGKGVKILKEAGIHVDVGLCGEQINRFLGEYLNKS